MVNHLGLTQRMNREMEIGTVEPVEAVSPANESDMSTISGKSGKDPGVWSVNMIDEALTESVPARRKRQLNELFSQGCPLQGKDEEQLLSINLYTHMYVYTSHLAVN